MRAILAFIIKKNDVSFRGMDLDARFKEAEGKIALARSLSQILGIVTQAVLDLDDSHTFFLPPSRVACTDYEWQMQIIGDKCYVVAVEPEAMPKRRVSM